MAGPPLLLSFPMGRSTTLRPLHFSSRGKQAGAGGCGSLSAKTLLAQHRRDESEQLGSVITCDTTYSTGTVGVPRTCPDGVAHADRPRSAGLLRASPTRPPLIGYKPSISTTRNASATSKRSIGSVVKGPTMLSNLPIR